MEIESKGLEYKKNRGGFHAGFYPTSVFFLHTHHENTAQTVREKAEAFAKEHFAGLPDSAREMVVQKLMKNAEKEGVLDTVEEYKARIWATDGKTSRAFMAQFHVHADGTTHGTEHSEDASASEVIPPEDNEEALRMSIELAEIDMVNTKDWNGTRSPAVSFECTSYADFMQKAEAAGIMDKLKIAYDFQPVEQEMTREELVAIYGETAVKKLERRIKGKQLKA